MAEVLTESFCERCGTRYTFESAKPRVKRLTGVKVLSRGLKNFVLSDDSSLDEAMAAARSDTEREVTSQQLDAFHKTFNFCMTCRQYTCANCWNEAEGTCLTCSPHLGHEIMPAPFPNLDPLGTTVALGAVDAATGTGAAATNGANGNGHAAPAYDAGAWPSSDAWPSHDLTEDAPAADVPTYTATDDDEIDVAARMAALTAIGSSQVATPEPAEATVEIEVAAPVDSVAEPIGSEADRLVEATPGMASGAASIEGDAEPEPVVATSVEPDAQTTQEALTAPEDAAAPPAPFRPATPASSAAGLTHDEVAATASAQTADLLHRFRPGESLDAELAAYERDHAEPAGLVVPAAAAAVVEDTAASDVKPIASVEPADDAGAPIAVDALIVAAAASALDDDAAVAAEAVGEPAQLAEPEIETAFIAAEADVATGQDAAAEAGPAAAGPEADVAAELPIVAAEPEPAMVAEPEPERAAELAAAAAAAAALAAANDRPTDVVAQPTWRIVAPEAEPATPPVVPTYPTPAAPVPPPAATAQPQWPAAPQWPDQPPATGLPFLGRPTQPTGGLDSLWAESNREVASAAPAPGRPVAPAGVQPCVSCGLSLSATARFCRRCGTAQHG